MPNQNDALARALATDEERRRRGQQAATKATGISAPSGRFDPMSIVEWVTGLPVTDPWLLDESKRDIFMRTVPQVAAGVLGSAAGAVGKRLMPPAPKPRVPHPTFDDRLESLLVDRDRIQPQFDQIENDVNQLLKGLTTGQKTYWEQASPQELTSHPEYARILELDRKQEPLRRALLHIGRTLPERNVAARVVSKKPITRREFFGEARQAARDRHLDTHDRALRQSNKADDEATALMADLSLDEPMNPFTPEEMPAMEWEWDRLNNISVAKAKEAGEAFKRFTAPSLIDRWKALVNAPTDAAAEVGRRLSDPSHAARTRRAAFQALARILTPK